MATALPPQIMLRRKPLPHALVVAVDDRHAGWLYSLLGLLGRRHRVDWGIVCAHEFGPRDALGAQKTRGGELPKGSVLKKTAVSLGS